jgi:hypothetical protein
MPGAKSMRESPGRSSCATGGRPEYRRGIFDAPGRLMVAIWHNMDYGFPRSMPRSDRHFSEANRRLTPGIRIGINYVVYAMTH